LFVLYTTKIKKKKSVASPSVGRNRSVGIAIPCGLDDPGIESRWGGGSRFSAPVLSGPGAHPASYTMGTESFLAVKLPARGVTTHPLLAPRLKEE